MDRVTEILPAGRWQRGMAADAVRLAYDDRLRRRKRYVAKGGRAFLLDLAELTLLADGDGLRLSSGDIVAVEAEDEALLEVAGDGPFLARIAWHLGNRHVPVEIAAGSLRLRADHVMADLLKRLGAKTVPVSAPFNPEGGAYGALGYGNPHPHSRSPHPHLHSKAHEAAE